MITRLSFPVAQWDRLALGTEQVVSSIPGSMSDIYHMFIEPTIILGFLRGFSGYII